MKTINLFFVGITVFSAGLRTGHEWKSTITIAPVADPVETQDWAKQRLAKSPRHQEWCES
jgi:hypothetical protein